MDRSAHFGRAWQLAGAGEPGIEDRDADGLIGFELVVVDR